MISNFTVLALVAAAVCTLILPVILLIILGGKKKISGLPLLLGASAFFLSQIIIRIPILGVISTKVWYINFAENHYIPLILLICLSAGLFEETARLGGAFILKKHRSFKDIISFGLGHAFCEVVVLIGFTHINNIILSSTVNQSGGVSAVALPPEMMQAVMQLATVSPAYVYLGILERVSAVIFHIFATVLVFSGVIQRKMSRCGLAIAAHTLFNFAGVMAAHYAGIVVSEILLLAMASAAGYYILKTQKSMMEIS